LLEEVALEEEEEEEVVVVVVVSISAGKDTCFVALDSLLAC